MNPLTLFVGSLVCIVFALAFHREFALTTAAASSSITLCVLGLASLESK